MQRFRVLRSLKVMHVTLLPGLVIGCLCPHCMLSSPVVPLDGPKWLRHTGVNSRSHYNSQEREVCSLAALYVWEIRCGSHSFHVPLWSDSNSRQLILQMNLTLNCCLCRTLEWKAENGIERNGPKSQCICCFVCQTDAMTLLVKLSWKGHSSYWTREKPRG